MSEPTAKPASTTKTHSSGNERILSQLSVVAHSRLTHVVLVFMLALAAVATLSSSHSLDKVQQLEAVPAAANLTSNIRILPLGDSITEGWGSTHLNGYRGHLKSSLDDLGMSSTFVGSQKTGDMVNNDHEGFMGLIINHILMRVRRDKILESQPDVVLLHAGTNDMAHGGPRQYWRGATSRFEVLLNETLHVAPNATVIVAQITQSSLDGLKDRIIEYNAAIPGLVATHAEAGAKVLTVDMSSIGSEGSHLVDGAHPDDEGYAMMAQIWLSGLQAATEKGWIDWPQTAHPMDSAVEEAYDEWQTSRTEQPSSQV